MGRPTRWPDLGRSAAVLLALALTSACTSEASDGDEAAAPPVDVSTSSTSGPDVPESSPPSPTAEPLPEVHHPLSLPALMREAPSGGRPRILRTEYETADYSRYDVT